MRRGRGRLQILTAQIADGTGQISATWFNQPWLEDKLTPGTHVRLRGSPNRYGFAVRSYDLGRRLGDRRLRARLPRERGVSATKLRELVAAALPLATDRPDPLPAALKRGARAAAARRRARRAAPAALARGGRGRAAAARLRRAARAPARARAARGRARGDRGGRAAAAGRAGRALPRGAPVRADRAPGARRSRRSTRDLARTTPMQRLLQGDVGSGKTVVALYALLRAVEAGRQGALMAPTETLAEQHFLTIEGICAELGVAFVAAHERAAGEGARGRARADRERRGADRGRHARADPAGGRVRRPRGRRRRRAAPLRRRAALGARRGTRAARPAHDRDADPAHARADRLRRPRGQRDREAAGVPQADRDRLGDRRAQLGEAYARLRAHLDGRAPGLRRLPADRGVGDDASRAPPRQEAERLRRGELQGLPRRLHARAAEAGRAARADGARSRRASSTCSSRRP